jgi:hypothetical protein
MNGEGFLLLGMKIDYRRLHLHGDSRYRPFPNALGERRGESGGAVGLEDAGVFRRITGLAVLHAEM